MTYNENERYNLPDISFFSDVSPEDYSLDINIKGIYKYYLPFTSTPCSNYGAVFIRIIESNLKLTSSENNQLVNLIYVMENYIYETELKNEDGEIYFSYKNYNVPDFEHNFCKLNIFKKIMQGEKTDYSVAPFIKNSENQFIEGYFYSSESTNLPIPVTTDVAVDENIINLIKKWCNNGCSYLGFSFCRVCNKTNGSCESHIISNGVKWIVPEGYVHCVTEHNVHPSAEFVEFLRNITDENLEYCNLNGLISN